MTRTNSTNNYDPITLECTALSVLETYDDLPFSVKGIADHLNIPDSQEEIHQLTAVMEKLHASGEVKKTEGEHGARYAFNSVRKVSPSIARLNKEDEE